MKVYMTGVIYLNGCNEAELHAYAPTDQGHRASVWVERLQLNETVTQWWAGSWQLRSVKIEGDDVEVVEFKIPGAAKVTFPGTGTVKPVCSDLEDGLPKLKKKNKKKKADDPDVNEDFTIDPSALQASTEVTMIGGAVGPRRLGSLGLVEWNTDPGLQITVQLKASGQSQTITLNTSAANVVFSNMHDLPAVEGQQDALAGNHVPIFRSLSGEADAEVFSVDAKIPGLAGQLTSAKIAALRFMQKGGCSCGSTPCCCRS